MQVFVVYSYWEEGPIFVKEINGCTAPLHCCLSSDNLLHLEESWDIFLEVYILRMAMISVKKVSYLLDSLLELQKTFFREGTEGATNCN